MKLSDIDYIKQRIPDVEFVAPRNARGVFGGVSPLVVRKNKSSNYNVYGDFPEYTKIATKKIYDGGRFVNEEDIKYRRKVCVIGERTQTELFEKDEDLILIQFNSEDLGSKLVFEEPYPKDKRKGLFPHFYSELKIENISNFWEIQRGAFILPEEVILEQEN